MRRRRRRCSSASAARPRAARRAPASSARAIGTRRLTRYSRASRHPAAAWSGAVRRPRPGGLPGAGRCRPAAVTAAAPGSGAGAQRGQVGGEPGVPGRGGQRGEPLRPRRRPARSPVRCRARRTCGGGHAAWAARRMACRRLRSSAACTACCAGLPVAAARAHERVGEQQPQLVGELVPLTVRRKAARSRHVERAERHARVRGGLAADRQRLRRAAARRWRIAAATWVARTGAPGRPATSPSTGASAAVTSGR